MEQRVLKLSALSSATVLLRPKLLSRIKSIFSLKEIIYFLGDFPKKLTHIIIKQTEYKSCIILLNTLMELLSCYQLEGIMTKLIISMQKSK